MKLISRLLSVFFFLLIFSCNKTNNDLADFSSPQHLFADYIASYTSGIISSSSEIKIRLTKKIEKAVAGEKIQESLLSFEPSLEGQAYWEDAYTVAFQPEEKLEGGQVYKARLQLNKILETPKDKEEFKFVFHVMPQNYEVKIGDLGFYDIHTLDKVKLSGEVQTADLAEDSAIEKILTASQNNNELKITWDHSQGRNTHRFIIENITRTKDKGGLEIAWNGTPLDVEKSDKIKFEIPALDTYAVLSAKLVRGEESYLSVHFSDPLMIDQDLTGLVQIHQEGNAPRLVVNLNELKIYPNKISGEEVDLTIYQEVRNISGKKLGKDFNQTLEFTQQNPELKLTLKQNSVILPGSEGLILPFEAVGLSAVDVSIVKIYEENVLQYLQVNNLGGTNEIKRVGRPVVQKVIPLNGSGVVDLQDWNRFTLDLSEIMETEPGAVYQVSINFRKSQALNFCAEDEQVTEEQPLGLGNWDDPDSPSYWDYYEYNYDNYNWQQRDNPCSQSYYTNRSISKVLFASDLGIIAKKSDLGNLKVVVTNLLTTQPEVADVEVYDFQQQLIAQGKTSSEGIADLEVTSKPFAIVVKNGDQRGYLKLTDGTSLSLSNFDVSGQTIRKGIKGFIYGERGVWRPGDTLHLSFILEDKQHTLPESHPVIMELYNPKGQLVSRKVNTQGVSGMYYFSLNTPGDAPTGNWQAKVKVGGTEFTERLKIETVKPNRLKTDLKFGKEKLTALDDQIRADLNVRWLHGAKGKNLRTQIEVLMVPTPTVFKNYQGFTFDDASKEYFTESEIVFDGRVDSEGNASINIPLNNKTQAPGALNAIFKTKAFEEGGDFSIGQFNIPYYPYTSFVGIKTPEGDKRGLLLTDEDHTIKIATVDANGNPISRKNLKVELYKLEWRWWWDNGYENISNYVGRSYQTPVQETTVDSQNGTASWKLRINHPEWGRYFVKVTDPESGHSTGEIVAVDWPGWASGSKDGLDGVTMLNFETDKEEYKVGETVKLNIPGGEGGRALISLESGSKIIRTFWAETKAGSTTVEFVASEEMAPNIYAHITLIQPHAQTANDLPIRLYGVQSIEIVDPNTQLQPLIQMDSELRPESAFKVSVKEQSGKPMAYTLAVVEDGLLDLTQYKTPAPWKHFYAREALGVKTWDMYNDVIGAFGANIERLLAVGGDGDIKIQDDKEANRFKPVVKYLGPFYLEAGKTASHKLEMPQYIGSVRTMVIAANNGAYGAADVTTPVKQPLMVLATLPRVAGPGEDIVLPVNIFTTNKTMKQVKVEIKATGQLQVEGASQKTVNFSQPGDQVSYFKLKASEALGQGNVVVTATSGSFKATYDVTLNIRASNPPLTAVDDKLLPAKEKWQVAYDPVGITGTNEGVIEISTLPPLNLEQRLQYLIQYPHGCVEQITSSVFAQLYLEKLTTVNAQRKEQIENNVKQAISALRAFQLSTGGFTYWPGNNTPDAWGTNYAGHFLLEAKSKGYSIPEGLLSSWINFQDLQASQWSPGFTNQDDLTQAYRLYTLALAGKPAVGAMNRMKEREYSTSTRWRLALAYAVAGYKDEAQKLVENLTTEVIDYKELSGTYGSQERDQAMILETLVALGNDEKAFELLTIIAEKMGSDNRWMSTQTTAYCLIAISRYAEKHTVEKNMNVKVSVNNRTETLTQKQFVTQIFLSSPQQAQNISVENLGGSPVYARLIKRGVPLTGNEQETARNIGLTVRYTTLEGDDLDVNSIKQGTDFKAMITVHNSGMGRNYEELALSQIFPSGWEIINTRLDDTQQYYNQGKADYQDIRDDRVYTYFDLKANERKAFTVLLNASYQGKYYLPAVAVEAMYDNSIYANKKGQWVEVNP